MTKRIPDYLKLHVEDIPSARPEPREVRALDAACLAFCDATGWELRFRPETPGARRGLWSMPIGAADQQVGQLVLQPSQCVEEAVRLEDVQPLAEAIGQLASEAQQAQHTVWQREAELAAGIPVTIRADEQQHLAERMESVLRGGAQAIGCQAAALYLLDDATSHLKLRACWRLPRTRFLDPPRPLRGAVADLEALVGHAVALEDTSLLPHWKVPEDFPAALCVPVSTAMTPLGTLWFFADRTRDFTQEQTHLAEIIAGRLVADLEREMLVREGEFGQRDDASLQALSRWQEGQAPRIAPLIDGWQVAGRTARADAVGGDLFDWCILPDGRLALTLGHASGPPIAAALTAGSVQAALKVLVNQPHEPRQILAQLNEMLWSNSAGDRFASLLYAVIEPETGVMDYSVAGQITGLIGGPPVPRPLKTSDSLLGMDPDTRFDQFRQCVQAGELLAFWSRGRHSPNPHSDQPDASDVSDLLQWLGDDSADDHVDRILHQPIIGQPHDRTALVAKRDL